MRTLDGQWNWWRIYFVTMPVILLAVFFIGIDKFIPYTAFIGSTMAFIVGRAVQQTADKDTTE